MATQQGSGLFGMPTPQEARQQYEQGLFLSPAQIGSQGLLQQVVSTIGEAGAGVGYGLGRMLGGMPAQEAEAIGMQEAAAEVAGMGITDPSKRMTALADALQKRGLSRAAMQALEKGRAMKLQDLQTQQAESGLMTLKPIKGAMRVVGKDSLGNPVYKQDIIGYQQGNRFMTPAQAEAYIKGLSPADAAAATGTPPPLEPKDAAGILRQNVARAAAKETETAQAAATQAAREPAAPDEALIFPKPLGQPATPKDLETYQEPGAFTMPQKPSRLGTPITAESTNAPSIYSGTPEQWKAYREQQKKQIKENIQRLKELDKKMRQMGRGEK